MCLSSFLLHPKQVPQLMAYSRHTINILSALKNNPEIHKCNWKSDSVGIGAPHKSHMKAELTRRRKEGMLG